MRNRLRSRSIFALITISLLSGCVVGPDYAGPNMHLPLKWAAADGQSNEKPPELASWWNSFNDPILTSYIIQVSQTNLDVSAAIARVREARAVLAQDRGGLFPTIDTSNSVMRQQVAETASPLPDSPSTQWQTGLSAGWEIDLFGGRQRSVEASRYGLDAAEEDLRNVRLVLIGDVASNYTALRAAQARLALARRTASSQRETAALTRARYESGTATTAEVSRAEALAATTEADIPAIEIDRAVAVHRLGVLLGRAPAELASELQQSRPIPRPKLPMPAGIPADTLLARPDVRMAERQLAQATARIGVAEAARYPSINLTGSIASQALTIGDIAKQSTIAWSVGPALTIPIFRGGQLKAAVEIANARRDASAARYQSVVLSAMEEIENAIVALNQNRIRSGKLREAIAAYRSSSAGSRAQYEAGTLDYLNLLDVQRAQYQAEAAWINSQLALTQAYISLNRSLGGGWMNAQQMASSD